MNVFQVKQGKHHDKKNFDYILCGDDGNSK